MRMTNLENELAWRASKGLYPVTIQTINERLKALGYRLDRSMDCRSLSRYMTGERAGKSYPCVSTYQVEIDTGLSAYNVDSRRDDNHKALQALRMSGECFAVSCGAILEL